MKNITREKTTIKLNLPAKVVWRLLDDLDFWLNILPGKVTQLNLDGELKAGVTGQAVMQGKTYQFNILAWEKNTSLSFRISQADKPLLLCQVDLQNLSPETQLTFHLFNYTHRWWHRWWTRGTVKRWWQELVKNSQQTIKELEPITNSKQKPNLDLNLPRGFYLWQMSNQHTRQLKQVLKPFNLTPTQWYLLYAIDKLHQDQTKLTLDFTADNLQLHPVIISDVVKVLVKKNLIRKIKSPENRRAFHLKPSPMGKRLLDLSTRSVKQFDEQFFDKNNLTKLD